MAVVTTHVLSVTFATADSSSMTLRLSNFNPEADEEYINAFVNAVIASGSIFKSVPTLAKSAKIVATTTTDVDLDV